MIPTVHLVPHTHWDREWYLPFQRFRMRLVGLMDSMLDLLEADPDFAFTMDGQLAALDDYLEIRPEAADRVRRLAAQGRLTVGPWTVLLDEFLVSGETIVRNLEAGTRRGAELGPVMAVGYLPDMFGHVAQMPQILRRAGITEAVVWRGVPAAIDTSAFTWAAPDGSAVRTEYLLGGYGAGVQLLTVPDRVAERIDAFRAARQAFSGGAHVLAMLGDDHAMPRPETSALVAAANAQQEAYQVEITTIAGYLDAVRGADRPLPSWTGELRSGARANLLMGVTSLRLPLRQAAARAERALERYAEPLHALHGADWPVRLLDLAWRNVIVNSAHDSICGCSLDEVDAQVRVRYAEAEQIGSGLADVVLQQVAATVPRGRWLVANPSPRERRALVELDVVVAEDQADVALELPDGTLVAAQAETTGAPVLYDVTSPGRTAGAVFDRMHARELLGRLLNGYGIGDTEDGRELTLLVDTEPDPLLLDVVALRAEIEQTFAADPDTTWRVRVIGQPRRALTAVVPVPPLGFTTVRAVPGQGTAAAPVRLDARRNRAAAGPGAGDTPMRPDADDSAAAEGDNPARLEADHPELSNGLVSIGVAADGTLEVVGGGVSLRGVGRLVDGGDAGDSYNYAPPGRDLLVDVPDRVQVRVEESGPVRGVLVVERRYRWPVGLAPDLAARGEDCANCTVTMRVELRAGEPFVRLRLALDNPARDHRLRFHVPLPRPVDRSWAEGQFAVVERGLEAEGGHGEHPLPTFPARGFVAVDGVAALLEHVVEYELVDGGSELALTVLRATGMISRNANPYRVDPAGPELAIPGAQLRGPCELSFALLPFAGAWHEAGVVEAAEAYAHPFAATRTTGTPEDAAADLPGPGLALTGPGVVLSALRRRDDWLEIRLVCERPTSIQARLTGAFTAARTTDLLGRPEADLPVTAGALDLDLSPWEIRTLQLHP